MSESNDLYLGRHVDEQNEMIDQPLDYELEHLTTHALLLGTTGSGKTGLGLVLVEEVLRKGIPVLLLDVKGDLANLLLTFPDLAPDDFAPWIDVDAARRKGQTPDQAAQATADLWRNGLDSYGLGTGRTSPNCATARISRSTRPACAPVARWTSSRASAHRPPAIPTPPRSARRVSRPRCSAWPASMPTRSRAASTSCSPHLMRHAWETQGSLDVPTLIQQVQQPPMERIGVFDMDSFFPQKDRFTLALTLNNLIAAPGFARWREGEPLDIDQFLFTPEGKPRATVFYLAHLPEEQRHFFVTLFLEELRTWVRSQAGTRTLRAMLFFDEIFGYLPPHPHNPPTKEPLMALVKQGRAAGMGVVLSTQNPADLDYKGLGNIGTWFVGSLRTDRDKMRVLEGMEGAIADAGMETNAVENALSRLKSRVFLMHDAREGALQFFHSRWAMTYLRGPLTQAETQKLAALTSPADRSRGRDLVQRNSPGRSHAATRTTTCQHNNAKSSSRYTGSALHPTRHRSQHTVRLPSGDEHCAVGHPQSRRTPAHRSTYTTRLPPLPRRRGHSAHLQHESQHLSGRSASLAHRSQRRWKWNLRWEQADMIDLKIDDLLPEHPDEGVFEPLPKGIGAKSAHTKRESAFKTHLYHNSQITTWSCTPLKLYSDPDETKRAFLERCRQEMEAQKKAALATEQQKHKTKVQRVEAKIRKEELELDEDQDMLGERRREELLSGAESVFNLFAKRRRASRALSQTSRQRRYVKKAKADVEESEEQLVLLEEELEQLEETWAVTEEQVVKKWEATLDVISEVQIRAKRTDIDVQFCGLVWFPFWEIDDNGKTTQLPAYVAQ